MKTSKQQTLVLTSLCLLVVLYSCNRFRQTSETVTEPFEANFTGIYTYVGTDTLVNPRCIAPPFNAWRAIVDGKGIATQLDSFIVHFDFCGDTLSNYDHVIAYMVDAAGDSLYISCKGRVLDGKQDDHPAFVTSYWRDPFEILGGTGKFKGATGSGKTDDYNSSEDPNSHHHWVGTITRVKGKE